MSQDDIFTRVQEIVARELEVENLSDVKPESNFIDDLRADSLACVELVVGLEQEFEMEIPDEEAKNIMTTVQSCVDYISTHLANPKA